jgi:predicted nucleic acid-binding protein
VELVVDASSLFAAMIGRGKAYRLFFEDRLKLVADSYLLLEFSKNIGEIAKICNKPESDIIEVFNILSERIEILPPVEYSKELLSKAEKLSPHPKDTPYFALALYLNCGIWSREKDFRKQSVIMVYNTPELVDIFGA